MLGGARRGSRPAAGAARRAWCTACRACHSRQARVGGRARPRAAQRRPRRRRHARPPPGPLSREGVCWGRRRRGAGVGGAWAWGGGGTGPTGRGRPSPSIKPKQQCVCVGGAPGRDGGVLTRGRVPTRVVVVGEAGRWGGRGGGGGVETQVKPGNRWSADRGPRAPRRAPPSRRAAARRRRARCPRPAAGGLVLSEWDGGVNFTGRGLLPGTGNFFQKRRRPEALGRSSNHWAAAPAREPPPPAAGEGPLWGARARLSRRRARAGGAGRGRVRACGPRGVAAVRVRQCEGGGGPGPALAGAAAPARRRAPRGWARGRAAGEGRRPGRSHGQKSKLGGASISTQGSKTGRKKQWARRRRCLGKAAGRGRTHGGFQGNGQ
jgi:hypothetical protein